MSLSSRQVIKQVNKIVEDRMKEGYIPTVDYLSYKLGQWYSVYTPGVPFFKARQQPYRKLFDVDSYNNNLQELYDDLTNLYEELVDQFTVVLKDFDYYDTQRHSLMHQIQDQEGKLTDLLLVSADTEGYVYSVHDDFIDRSKINLTYSTCEINTDSGIVTLRESRSGILKLNMSHYFDVINFPIEASEIYSENILSNTLFPMSKFGYAFSDTTGSWAQNIVTNTPGVLQVSFVVDLNPKSDGEYITRIEMQGQSSKEMTIQPLYSLDNINFVVLPIGSGTREKKVSDNKVTTWNFDQTRVKYVKFLITKTIEDEQVSAGDFSSYRYIIGFKHISFYKMGYDLTSVLYSTAYEVTDPAGEALTIDKASIVVDSDVQLGTDISYYLSLGSNDTTDPTQYNWAQISASNDTNPQEQQVVDFKHVAFFGNVPEVVWNSGSYGTPLESYYGIDFYKVYQFPYEPIKNSVELYRGKNDWQVSPTYEVGRKSVYDEKHVFGSSTTTTLTFPNFTVVEGEGLIRGSIKVKSDPGQNPAYWATTPGDYSVNYTTKVITRNTGGNISGDPSSPANTIYVDYQYDDELVEPTVYTTYVYILNQEGVTLGITPFSQAEIDGGQFTKITTSEGEIDESMATKVNLSPGWHRVSTTGEPFTANDRFFYANANRYLHDLVYKQFAYADKLQEVSWFDLKYTTLKSDHSKYCIIDYDGDGNKEIIVNYRPQTAAWSSSANDLLCSRGTETYVLSYKFITTATSNIYFKAVFTRNSDTSASATSTLKSYTVKLGY